MALVCTLEVRLTSRPMRCSPRYSSKLGSSKDRRPWPMRVAPRSRMADQTLLAAQKATYANRRRNQGQRGKDLQRCRSELVERPNAHIYDTGGMRRLHLRGRENILKRLLVHVCGFNLGLVMQKLIGRGTPRGLQGRLEALLELVWRAWAALAPENGHLRVFALSRFETARQKRCSRTQMTTPAFSTGC